MKTYLSALIVIAGLFITTEGFAQMPMSQMMGGAYGRNGMMNRTGMDRGIGVNQYSNGKRKTSTDKVDPLEASLNHLETELTLDSFQKAVIKDLMVKNQAEETKVLNQEIPEEAKIEKFGILRDKLDTDIKKLLSKDQVDLFAKMKEKMDKKKI